MAVVGPWDWINEALIGFAKIWLSEVGVQMT